VIGSVGVNVSVQQFPFKFDTALSVLLNQDQTDV
jgi:hypothetical protein